MNIKKLTAIILLTTLIASIFASCGSDNISDTTNQNMTVENAAPTDSTEIKDEEEQRIKPECLYK